MRKLVNGYIVVSLLLVLDLSLYFGWRISIIGYWSDRVLFWIWLVLTVVVIVKSWRRRGTKIYAALLVLLLILSMVPMMIPFFSIILVGFGLERDYAKNIDEKIRIQQVNKSLLSRATLEVIEKKGIYEQKIGSFNSNQLGDEETPYSIQDLNTLQVLKRAGDSIQVELIFKQKTFTYWMQND
jgi:hypothetical protein